MGEQIPSFCTMLFHNHPAEYSTLDQSDSSDLARIQDLKEQLERGDFEFLKRYIPNPTCSSAYNWIANAELSSADLKVPTSAQLLIRGSTRLHTAPEDRLSCFDTFRVPKRARSVNMKAVPITIFDAVREMANINQIDVLHNLRALKVVASGLWSKSNALFGPYDAFFTGLREQPLADYVRKEYASMSSTTRNWHGRALDLAKREYDALQIDRSKVVRFAPQRWQVHEEIESQIPEVGGMHTLSIPSVQGNATTLVSQIRVPTPDEMKGQYGSCMSRAWEANHQLLSGAFLTAKIPEFAIGGMTTDYLLEFKSTHEVSPRQRFYTLAEWKKGSYSLFHLYHLAAIAACYTGAGPGASGPGGGFVLLHPASPMERLKNGLERTDNGYFLLEGDPVEMEQYAEAKDAFPARVEFLLLKLQSPIAVIDVEELLPTYSRKFIQSTRTDNIQVAVRSRRLSAQKLVARLLDIFREDAHS